MKTLLGKGLVIMLIVGLPQAGRCFIERIYPLEEVLKECTHINVGRIAQVDVKARTGVLELERALKGSLEFKKVNMNIALGPAHHGHYIIERLHTNAPALLFYKQEGRNIASLVFSGDTWFQLYATDDPAKRDQVWWRFTHVEIKMGRTFNGTTPEFLKLVEDVLAKRRPAPKPDPTVPTLSLTPAVVKTPTPTAAGGGFRRQFKFNHNGGQEVRGLSFADVNGDGRLDVLACRQSGNVLLLNLPSGFKNATAEWGLRGGSRSAGWADYDADGRPDLMTDRFELWHNTGKKFENVSSLLGKTATAADNTEGAGWLDYDADGRPDLLITTAEKGIRLLRNTGKGPKWFEDVSDRAGLGERGFAKGNGDFVAFFDYNNDGWTDFFYNLNSGIFALNQGNQKFQALAKTGLGLTGGDYKRGLCIADYDLDEQLEVFVPASGRPSLYHKQPDSTFKNVIASAGDLAKLTQPSFAGAWADVNADGHLDLLVCLQQGSVRLYLGNDKGSFTDSTRDLGLDQLKGVYNASFADLDQDGDLDLVANLPDKIVIAFNDIPPPAKRGRVTVAVQARRGLTGAMVRVLDAEGRPLGSSQLCAAESCGGQSAPLAGFSLPSQPCTLYVALSDGRLAHKRLEKVSGTQRISFHDQDFQ